MNESAPSLAGKTPVAHGEQPSDAATPAKNPDEPAIARMVLNCACSTVVRPKLNTALPLPCCSARSAAEKVIGAASEKLPTDVVVLLKIFSTRVSKVIPVPPVWLLLKPMPTWLPLFHPNAESVGVVVLSAPEMASGPFATLTGVAKPVSNVLLPCACSVNSLGAFPKPCAPRSVKLAAGVPPTRTRLACAALLNSSTAAAPARNGRDLNFIMRHAPLVGPKSGHKRPGNSRAKAEPGSDAMVKAAGRQTRATQSVKKSDGIFRSTSQCPTMPSPEFPWVSFGVRASCDLGHLARCRIS